MRTAAAELRAWAKGDYAQEAGVELLIRAFDGRFAQQGSPWIEPCSRPGSAWVDVSVLLAHAGVWSSGERRVLTVVAALVDDRPIGDLADVLTGLDRPHLTLVLAALAHAGGSHQHADLVREGDRLVFASLPALVAWPVDRRAA